MDEDTSLTARSSSVQLGDEVGRSAGVVYEAWKRVPEKRGSGIDRTGGCVRKIPRCCETLVQGYGMREK